MNGLNFLSICSTKAALRGQNGIRWWPCDDKEPVIQEGRGRVWGRGSKHRDCWRRRKLLDPGLRYVGAIPEREASGDDCCGEARPLYGWAGGLVSGMHKRSCKDSLLVHVLNWNKSGVATHGLQINLEKGAFIRPFLHWNNPP